MITQIEIDGFKSFKDFKVEFAPFQVIVGANGSGKSNLFDALQLLGRLATMNLREAFQDVRGEPDEVFTTYSRGNPTSSIRLAVEMFVHATVKDALGREQTLQTQRLRYEVEIERGLGESHADQLQVAFESLTALPSENDTWMQRHLFTLDKDNQQIAADKTEEFIVTERLTSEGPHIRLIPDGRGTSLSMPYPFKNTALQSVTSTEYPHVFAVHEELRSLRFFHLNPTMLRQPSSTKAPQTLEADGKNLAATLFRMQREDKFVLADVSRDMANLVPGILKVRVARDKIGDRYVIYADTTDKGVFSSQVLSDGTLRLLALAMLKNDPQLQGIICLEEPENGVSPLHLERMAHLLRRMATDLKDLKSLQKPFCQVLITTHSPLFISQPDVIDALLLAFVPTRIQGKGTPLRVTRMAPVITSEALSHLQDVSRDDKAIGAYSFNTLRNYLDSELLEEARERLEKGQRELNER